MTAIVKWDVEDVAQSIRPTCANRLFRPGELSSLFGPLLDDRSEFDSLEEFCESFIVKVRHAKFERLAFAEI